VPYRLWQRTEDFESHAALSTVFSHTRRLDCAAAPIGDSQSPWMVIPDESMFEALRQLTRGVGGYRAWEGANTRGGNGLFWLQVLRTSGGVVYCRNTPEFSKKKPPEQEWGFEPDLIYPMLRGRETSRWLATPSLCLLFPHRGDSPLPREELETEYPKTWGYLRTMEDHLRKRRMYDLSRKDLPFWSLFETGSFLVAPYKVVWKYVASSLTCAVVDSHHVDGLTNHTVIPDHKLIIVPLKRKAEAHYVCAALNSRVARFLAKTYVVGTQISAHILEFIKVPPFDPENAVHARLSELSIECHKLASRGDVEGISRVEAEVDDASKSLWRLTNRDLALIRTMLPEQNQDKQEDGD
jgi:hypothetical protein